METDPDFSQEGALDEIEEQRLEASLWNEVEKDSNLETLLTKKKFSSLQDDNAAGDDDGIYVNDDTIEKRGITEDVRDLTQLLLNEMSSPDLQPYRLFENLKQKVRTQQENALGDEA